MSIDRFNWWTRSVIGVLRIELDIYQMNYNLTFLYIKELLLINEIKFSLIKLNSSLF